MTTRPRVCPDCANPYAPGDTFCRACGKRIPLDLSVDVQSHWTLLAAIATMGPFAIPLVWRFKKFSRAEKYFWTAAIALFTAILCVVFYFLMRWSIQIFMQFAALSNQL